MGKPIIWSGTNAKLINSGDLIDKNNLSLTNGAKITVTQASHGFTSSDVGCPLYLNGSTWTKAIASASNTAEVAGFIYAVIDSNTLRIASSGQCPTVGANFLEGGGSLTAGELYFLSPTTAGKVTATEPTTIGSVSKPVAIATSTTAIQFFNMRGYVVGAANARTQISLSNNTTNNVQNVTAYDAGNITGWVYIDATTDYRFYVSISWAKNGAGTNWNINYSTVGDTPPVGFSFTITSGGIIQYTMPSVTGFVSSQFNYAINAPAVGTLFPLSIDGSAVVSGTVAAARLPANLSVTELQAATTGGLTFKRSDGTISGTVSNTSVWTLGGAGTAAYEAAIKVDVASGIRSSIASWSGSTSTRKHIVFENPNGEVGSISTNASATSYTPSSDSRIKQDSKDFDGLNIVMQLHPIDFEWKYNPGERSKGFYAQEVYNVLPEIVIVGSEEVKESGYPVSPWGVDYSKLTPVLTKAIQELKADLDAAKAEIELLKSK